MATLACLVRVLQHVRAQVALRINNLPKFAAAMMVPTNMLLNTMTQPNVVQKPEVEHLRPVGCSQTAPSLCWRTSRGVPLQRY